MENGFSKLAMFTVIILLFQTHNLLAYVGPGTGMSAIGTFIAFVFGIFVAILGFVWYPIKRLLKKKSKEPDQINKNEK
jgi:ABC-type nitrate/sulfonate/bicarbonate transport system permease component